MRLVLIKSSHFITASETKPTKIVLHMKLLPQYFLLCYLPCRHRFVCKPTANTFPGNKTITI